MSRGGVQRVPWDATYCMMHENVEHGGEYHEEVEHGGDYLPGHQAGVASREWQAQP